MQRGIKPQENVNANFANLMLTEIQWLKIQTYTLTGKK
jgi:hypothetical protein